MQLFNSKLKYVFSKTNIYNYLIQFGSIFFNLLLFSLLLKNLGEYKFGVWQTILSIITYTSLLNFGFGNGLRNSISKYYVVNDIKSIGNIIAQTIIKISKYVILFILIFFPLYIYFFSSSFFFNDINSLDLNLEIKYSIAIYLLFFIVNIITSLSSSIAFGIGKSYLPGFFNLLYIFIVSIFLYILKDIYKENLYFIALLFGIGQFLSNVILFVYILLKNNIILNFKDEINLKEINSTSGMFFIAQLLSIIFITSDNIIISKILGPDQTAQYSIIAKIYFTLITLFSVLLIKFWNEVTMLFSKNEFVLIKKNIRVLFYITFVVLFIGLGLAVMHEKILKLWFGNDINFKGLTILPFILFSIFTFLHCINAIFINLQNGLGDLKIQIISMIIMIVIMLVGIFILNKYENYNYLIIIKSFALLIGILININSLKKLNEINTN